MATPEHIRIAATFGAFMLAAGTLGLMTGVTLGKVGIVRRSERRGEFYTICICHLLVGAFCFFGQYFVHAQ